MMLIELKGKYSGESIAITCKHIISVAHNIQDGEKVCRVTTINGKTFDVKEDYKSIVSHLTTISGEYK